MEIWINPDCSKCRTALSELDAAGVDYTVRRYLEDTPTADELAEVVHRLGVEPWQIARDAETAAIGNPPTRDADHRGEWLAFLADHPQAIQRPIITADDGTAVIGRDPETLASVISRA
ncbi:MAG TPA: ArsC/Spx/MgsR family protein [Marmoricola sp.]|nr:ArsC/Spx/MgsR family protein [Marmoricola sp.]